MNRITLAIALTFSCMLPLKSAQKNKRIILTRIAEELPVLAFDRHEMLYIGHCEQRTQLEQLYGQKFALNEPFVALNLKIKKSDAHTYAHMAWQWQDKDDGYAYGHCYFPHSMVKDCQEGTSAPICLCKNTTLFVHCQQRGNEFYGHQSFETVMAIAYKKFCQQPDFLLEGRKSLLENKIIEKRLGWLGKYSVHGPKGDAAAYYISLSQNPCLAAFVWLCDRFTA
ncbi:MAG: hypothetical protein WCE21_03090 [Candidatus Babeliales bacterium]